MLPYRDYQNDVEASFNNLEICSSSMVHPMIESSIALMPLFSKYARADPLLHHILAVPNLERQFLLPPAPTYLHHSPNVYRDSDVRWDYPSRCMQAREACQS